MFYHLHEHVQYSMGGYSTTEFVPWKKHVPQYDVINLSNVQKQEYGPTLQTESNADSAVNTLDHVTQVNMPWGLKKAA